MNGLVQFVNAALVNCVNLLTYELHFAIAHWFYMPTWFYCLEVIYICVYMYMCIYTICKLNYLHISIGIYLYACMYIRLCLCTNRCICMYVYVYMMFLILISVCILSSFHPHHHHLSPNSPRLMFLFVDCATVNKVYLILSYQVHPSYFRVIQAKNRQFESYLSKITGPVAAIKSIGFALFSRKCIWKCPVQNVDHLIHGGPSEAGDCSHPPPKMATAKNASSCKATFDHVIGIGSLRFLACEQVLDIANPWYSNAQSSRDSLASRGTRIFQREAGDSMAPDRRRRVTHGWEAGDSYFRFNFCELLFRCHTQY